MYWTKKACRHINSMIIVQYQNVKQSLISMGISVANAWTMDAWPAAGGATSLIP